MSSSFDVEAFTAAFRAGIADARVPMVEELYATLDANIEKAARALPPFACRKGCTACCYGPPTVTALEWKLLHRHLLTLEEEAWARIVDNAEMVRPLLPELARQHAERSIDAWQMQCAFLVDGACSVYSARPIICRGFGKTFINKGFGAADGESEPALFGSPLAHAHIQRTFPRKFHLPLLSTYIDRLRGMTREAKGVTAALPLWLFAHLDGRRLVPEVDVAPDFTKLVQS